METSPANPEPPMGDEPFANAFEYAAIGMALVSPAGSWLKANRAMCEMLGYSGAELRTRTFQEITHPDDLGTDLKFVRELLAGERLSYQMEKRYFHRSGRVVWALLSVSLVRDAAGLPLHFISQVQDITERKIAQETLRQAGDRLQVATRAAKLGIWDWDIPADRIVWDEGMYRLYGLPPGCAVDYQTWERSLHPEDKLRLREKTRRALAGEEEFDPEFRIVWPDGTERHIQANAVIQRDAGGRPVRMLGTNWDITERKRTEEELRVLAHRLQLAKELAGIGVFDHDVASDTLLWDERQHAIYGVRPGSGPPGMNRWRQRVHPEDLAAAEAASFGVLTDSPGGYDISYRIVRASDGAVRHLRSVAKVERNAAGQPVRVVGMNVDVTEETELQEHLRRASEAAEAVSQAKSEFLAMMSHEIRTPMNAVIGYGDLLRLTALTDEQAEFVANIQRGGTNLLEIIDGILDFSKIEAGKFALRSEPMDPRALIGDVGGLLAMTARAKGLEFSCEVAADAPGEMLGDAPAFKRILTNLIGNAIKFTDHGAVRLTAAREERPGGPVLKVEVADTGIGLAPATLERLFQPFSQGDSSHKRRFGGTGLGLAISRRLAEAMGGDLRAQAARGGGAVFVFSCPIADPGKKSTGTPDARPPAARREIPPVRPELRILLAEDNPVNRRLMTELLRRLGCTCDTVDDGLQAVEATAQKPYDVVLMDIQMPVMDGWEATRAIREREAAGADGSPVYVVAQSASAMEEDARKCREFGMDDQLCKPITLEALARTLARVPGAT